MCAKYYENPTMLSRVIAKNVGDVFFETQCRFFRFNRSRDITGSQSCKCGSRDPHMTYFELLLHYTVITHSHPSLAKFELSIFNRSRDIRWCPKIPKLGTWPPYDPFWNDFASFR